MLSRWGSSSTVITKNNTVITKHNKGKESKEKKSKDVPSGGGNFGDTNGLPDGMVL